MTAKKVLILGSTGSIGTQALEVIAASGDALQVVGLSAGSSWEPLLEQAREHGVPAVALADPEAAARAGEAWNGRVLAGEEGIRALIDALERRPRPQRRRRRRRASGRRSSR